MNSLSNKVFRHPKRVIVQVGPDRSARGGIASVLNGYALYESGFDALGYRMEFISSGGGDSSGKLLKALAAWFSLVSLITEGRVHLVHIHTALKGSLLRKILFAATCAALGKPYIFHVHNGAFFEYVERLPLLIRAFIRSLFRHASFVICLSLSAREQALSLKWASTAQCRLVYNGIEDPLIGRTIEQRRPDTVGVLYLGRLTASKGLETLLDAMVSLPDTAPRFTLYIAGSGNTEELERCIDERKLVDRVTFLGWITGSEKDAWLARSDIFVLPSFSEGFPVSIIEAMAFNSAIVSTRIPGVVDAIRDGQDGLLFTPGDADELRAALLKLLASAELRARLGASARARFVAEFTIEQTARNLADIYDAVGREKSGAQTVSRGEGR